MANVFQYSDAELTEFVSSTSTALRSVRTAEEAIAILKKAFARYTIFDLQRIGGAIRFEVERLPEPYKSRYRPYSTDPLNQYHTFLSETRSVAMRANIQDRALWDEFWQRAEEGIFSEVKSENVPELGLGSPSGRFFYRLVYGYAMLIAGRPGHPVGMPFPGGWMVKEKNGILLCPIRDKEKDLPQALCNYCPAEQDPECL